MSNLEILEISYHHHFINTCPSKLFTNNKSYQAEIYHAYRDSLQTFWICGDAHSISSTWLFKCAFKIGVLIRGNDSYINF